MVMPMTTLPAWTALAAALIPLVVAALVVLPATRSRAVRLASLAGLPALAAAAFVPDGVSELPLLVTGVTVALDPVARAFLALSALVWTAAALYGAAAPARPAAGPRFRVFFMLAMAGSLGLTVTVDPAGFYTLFALMALPTYALVAAGRGQHARRAGRVYMAFTVLGEALLVCGLFITGAVAFGLALPGWAVPAGTTLLLAAFGIKIGAVGLHGWMPVAYTAAPPAAAAALAGAMSKAGILGLIRFLPGGEPDAVVFGGAVMAFGVAAAFFGAFVGVMQTEPKTVLAYSSISQLGLITIGIGTGLAVPEVWPVAVIAATAYAVHHGLAKAALFLGEDVANRATNRTPVLVGLALPAVALAGLPLTSGAVAKIALKEATGLAPGFWHNALEILLPLAAIGTTMLMARFLFLVAARPSRPAEAGRARAHSFIAVAAWVLLLGAVAATLWLWPAEEVRYAAAKSLTTHYLWLATWPVLVGAAISGVVWFLGPGTVRLVGAIPPADVFAPIFARAHRFVERRDADAAATPATPAAPPADVRAGSAVSALLVRVGAVESGVLAWATATSAIGALTVLLLVLAARG